MAEKTYPWGYGSIRLTLSQMNARWSWNRLHPELRRRLVAMFDAHPSNGLGFNPDNILGCGGGARSSQEQFDLFMSRHVGVSYTTYLLTPKDRRVDWPQHATWGQTHRYWKRMSGAAASPPGRSYHEEQPLSDNWALACDIVGWQDGWANKNAAKFGLRSNLLINNEEWHYQPVETPPSHGAFTGQDIGFWDLPGGPTLPPPFPPPGVLIPVSNYKFRSPSHRAYDSRDGGGKLHGQRQIVINDPGFINGAIGAKLNIKVAETEGGGYLTVWDAGPQPTTNTQNWTNWGEVRAIQIDTLLGGFGVVQVYASAPAHILVDVVGYWFA